jgi:hypothetical protein
MELAGGLVGKPAMAHARDRCAAAGDQYHFELFVDS